MNQAALIDHSRRLGRRIGQCVDASERVLVLGGDCSILLGAALGLRSRRRFGLVHIDGHTDFRHPGKLRDLRKPGGRGPGGCRRAPSPADQRY